MKKIVRSFLVILVLTTGLLAKAAPDEGMWLPIFVEHLNYEEMQAMGLLTGSPDAGSSVAVSCPY